MAHTDTKKNLFIAALLAGATVTAAADYAGISRSTAQRWRKLPDVIARLRAAEADLLESLARRLFALSVNALAVVGEVLESKEAGDGQRLRAAALVLDNALKLRDAVDIEQRLAALEDKQP